MQSAIRGKFEIRGWHVLVAIIAFFAAITAVNAVMITLALRSFPGESEKKSYLQGLKYNDLLETRAEEAALGWRAIMVDGESLAAGNTRIRILFEDSGTVPVRGLAVTGRIGRPATDRLDQAIAFQESGDGVYVANIAGLEPGNWDLTATALDGAGRQLTLEKRLWLTTE